MPDKIALPWFKWVQHRQCFLERDFFFETPNRLLGQSKDIAAGLADCKRTARTASTSRRSSCSSAWRSASNRRSSFSASAVPGAAGGEAVRPRPAVGATPAARPPGLREPGPTAPTPRQARPAPAGWFPPGGPTGARSRFSRRARPVGAATTRPPRPPVARRGRRRNFGDPPGSRGFQPVHGATPEDRRGFGRLVRHGYLKVMSFRGFWQTTRPRTAARERRGGNGRRSRTILAG